MRRRLVLLIAALVMAAGSLIAAPGLVDSAAAHDSADSYSYCRLIEISTFGPEQNYVGFYYRTIHFVGLHITQCCFVSALNPAIRAMATYTIGFGITWPQNDPWCRSS